jgi:hypothetical protein
MSRERQVYRCSAAPCFSLFACGLYSPITACTALAAAANTAVSSWPAHELSDKLTAAHIVVEDETAIDASCKMLCLPAWTLAAFP